MSAGRCKRGCSRPSIRSRFSSPLKSVSSVFEFETALSPRQTSGFPEEGIADDHVEVALCWADAVVGFTKVAMDFHWKAQPKSL